MESRTTPAVVALMLAATIAPAIANGLEIFETPVTARIITDFRIGSDEQRFGPLEFAGGLEMVSSQRHFGAISAMVLNDDQTDFIAVADTGFWLTGSVVRDPATHQLTGLAGVSMAAIADENGQARSDKWLADAEGLAIGPTGELLVSFEREHRIETQIADETNGFYRMVSQIRPPVPLYELRQNRGFEGIAIAPETSMLAGALVGISEKSLDPNGNIMGFVSSPNGTSYEFSLTRRDGFDVTDLAFLPDGDLVVLERRFNVVDGVAMRLRVVDDAALQPKATVDGEIMLEADMRFQIDNMEALTVTVDADGVPRLTLASDDNHSLLQRNLLLEFRLVGRPTDR